MMRFSRVRQEINNLFTGSKKLFHSLMEVTMPRTSTNDQQNTRNTQNLANARGMNSANSRDNHNQQDDFGAGQGDSRGRTSNRNSQGGAFHVSPATLEHYLKGIHFPCDKQDLIQQAQSNNAEKDVLSVLDQFEDGQYNSVVEVAKEVGQIEGHHSFNSGQSASRSQSQSQNGSNRSASTGSRSQNADQNDNNRNVSSRSSQDGRSSHQGNADNSLHVSPATLEHFLKGIHFPCDKQDLQSQAQSNGAGNDVLNLLDNFEDGQYNSVVEVAKEVGRIEGANGNRGRYSQSRSQNGSSRSASSSRNDSQNTSGRNSSSNRSASDNRGTSSRTSSQNTTNRSSRNEDQGDRNRSTRSNQR